MASEDAYKPPAEIVAEETTTPGGGTTAAVTVGAASLSLAEVEAAISAFLSNGAIQSYTISSPNGGSRTVQRASLQSLIAWRDKLLGERAAQQSGGTVNIFRRGSY